MESESALMKLDEALKIGSAEEIRRLIQDDFSQIRPETILEFLLINHTDDEELFSALQKIADSFPSILVPAIFTACQAKRWNIVQLLIRTFRPDVMRMRDPNGFPILFYAASAGNFDLLKWLVTYGAKLNPADPSCFLILKAAIPYGNLEMVQFLISECHISANSPHEQAEIISLAAGQGNRNLLEFLLELWQFHPEILQNPILLHSAALGGYAEMMKYLLQHGADYIHPVQHESVLHAAVRSGSLDAVRLLVEFAAEHPAKRRLFSWNTPIFHIDALDAQHRTPLALAQELNHAEIAAFLSHITEPG